MSNSCFNYASWLRRRSAGSFLHISSLPSKTGIGNLGESSYSFIKFLKNSGMSFWQMCPVGPTGFGDSPYQVFSSSAGNPYFIDWYPFISAGLIMESDLAILSQLPACYTDFENLYKIFFTVARKVYARFQDDPNVFTDIYGDYSNFVEDNTYWLKSYCSFQAFKQKYNGLPWWTWPSYHRKEIECIAKTPEFYFQEFLQYIFRGQWKKLRKFATENEIQLIGDLPIYCAPDSADVWASPELFEINLENTAFEKVAGVPPDYFNADGQYWGNPLYKWNVHSSGNYNWWVKRLSLQLDLFDVIRIDHFRGFNDYWSIRAENSDAKMGKWVKGPGMHFWEIIKEHFPTLPFLAEDLGLITKDVRNLRDKIPLLGMAVLQFAFDGDPENLYLPHNLTNSLVLYSGTHDNNTTHGWYANSSSEIKDNFRSYLSVSGEDSSWDMIRLAYRSISPLVIIPVQDYLGLGSEARFNEPGISQGNWKWRMSFNQLEHLESNCSKYLLEQAKITGRVLMKKSSNSF